MNEGRIRRGWRLTCAAWSVLLRDSTALLLAGLQAVATVLVALAVFSLSGWIEHPGQESRLLVAVLVSYLPSTFISTFIGVALCAAVAAAMEGEHLSFGEALAIPLRRIGQVLFWSVLATGVGLLLEQLAARLPFATRVITWLAGMAWSIGTLFVLPILALNGCDAPECVRQSAKLVKQRWGEGIAGNLVIGAWSIVVMLPLAIGVGVLGAATHSRATTWLAYLAIVVLVGSVTSAASRVFSVALYRYAVGTGSTGPFPDVDLQQPFRRRPGRTGSFDAGAKSGAGTGPVPEGRSRAQFVRRVLLVTGAVLVSAVVVINAATQRHHGQGSSVHGSGAVVLGLIAMVGLLLLLVAGIMYLWTKRPRRRREV